MVKYVYVHIRICLYIYIYIYIYVYVLIMKLRKFTLCLHIKWTLTYCRLGGCGLASRGSAQVFVQTPCDNDNEPLGSVTIGDVLKQSTDC
jgi:hypothetical protein